jgi:hypothetical protein
VIARPMRRSPTSNARMRPGEGTILVYVCTKDNRMLGERWCPCVNGKRSE